LQRISVYDMMKVKMEKGRVDEEWLDKVFCENRQNAIDGIPLTEDFGATCIRFVDVIMCDPNKGFCKLDKLTKAEACSRVYLHLCDKIKKYKQGMTVKPSNWFYTMSLHALISAIRNIYRDDVTSDIVALVVGNEAIAKIDGIDRNAPSHKVFCERMAALSEFRLNANTKERIFGQVWNDSMYRRDGLNLVRRARQHNKTHAMSTARQMSISNDVADGIMDLLKERNNGRN